MKPNLISAITLSAALTLSGCASTYRPIVDPTGSANPGKYEQDLAECRNFAGGDAAPVVVSVIGGVIGLAFGALAVAGSGISGHSVQRFGAAIGAVSAGLGAVKQQKQIVARCMSGRGYSVLE